MTLLSVLGVLSSAIFSGTSLLYTTLGEIINQIHKKDSVLDTIKNSQKGVFARCDLISQRLLRCYIPDNLDNFVSPVFSIEYGVG